MKILRNMFRVESSIVFRCEESLDIYDKGKRIDKVVSGIVIKETVNVFGFCVRMKHMALYCSPVIDNEDVHARSELEKTLCSVKEKCEMKILEYNKNQK